MSHEVIHEWYRENLFITVDDDEGKCIVYKFEFRNDGSLRQLWSLPVECLGPPPLRVEHFESPNKGFKVFQ